LVSLGVVGFPPPSVNTRPAPRSLWVLHAERFEKRFFSFAGKKPRIFFGRIEKFKSRPAGFPPPVSPGLKRDRPSPAPESAVPPFEQKPERRNWLEMRLESTAGIERAVFRHRPAPDFLLPGPQAWFPNPLGSWRGGQRVARRPRPPQKKPAAAGNPGRPWTGARPVVKLKATGECSFSGKRSFLGPNSHPLVPTRRTTGPETSFGVGTTPTPRCSKDGPGFFSTARGKPGTASPGSPLQIGLEKCRFSPNAKIRGKFRRRPPSTSLGGLKALPQGSKHLAGPRAP